MKIDPELIIPDKSLSIREGAIKASGWSHADGGTIAEMYYEGPGRALRLFAGHARQGPAQKDRGHVCSTAPRGRRSSMRAGERVRHGNLHDATFEGIINNLERRFRETTSDWVQGGDRADCMSAVPCAECHGQRLAKESLAVTVGGINISALLRHVRHRGAGVCGRPGAERPGADDCRPHFKGDPMPGWAFCRAWGWST